MISFSDMNSLFYKALMTALDYDPEKWNNQKPPPVRQTNSTTGAPDWTINDDVVFFNISSAGADDMNTQVDEYLHDSADGKDLIRTHYQTRVIYLQLTAYGQNAYDNLIQIKHLFLDGSSILRKKGFFIVPDGTQPQRNPEYFQGEWWERADLTLTFNNLMTFDEKVKTIEKVPIHIDENKPGDSDVVIKDFGIVIKPNR